MNIRTLITVEYRHAHCHGHWNWYGCQNPDHCQGTIMHNVMVIETGMNMRNPDHCQGTIMHIETGMNVRILIIVKYHHALCHGHWNWYEHENPDHCQGTIMHIVMVIKTGTNVRTLITVKVPSCTLSWSLKLVWMWEPCSLSRYHHAHCHGHWNWYARENPDHCRGTIMHILKTCLNSNWDKANTEVSSKLRHASLSPSNTDPFTANNCIALMQLPSRLSLQDSLSCPKTLDWRTLIYAKIHEKLRHSFKQDARWHALVKWKTIWQGHPMMTWGQRKD